MSLSSKDELHLKKIKNCLKSNHIIKKYKIKRGYKTEYDECRLYISNKKFGKQLYEVYGIYPNRLSIQSILPHISNEFKKDFIRGIIDADGCITLKNVIYKSVERKEFSISITSSREVINFINLELINNQLTKTMYKVSIRHLDTNDGSMVSMRITGNIKVNNILNYFYNDSACYLQRKYELYEYIQNYMNNYNMKK